MEPLPRELEQAERAYLACILETRLEDLGDKYFAGDIGREEVFAEFLTILSIFVKLKLPMEYLHRGTHYLSLCMEDKGGRGDVRET